MLHSWRFENIDEFDPQVLSWAKKENPDAWKLQRA